MTHSKKQAKLFKALMHPARLEILNILRGGEECVCHMEAELGYRQAYISQHLAILRESGLIEDRRDGWNVFYRVVNSQVYGLMDAALQMMGEPVPEEELPQRSRNQACPCPKCTPAVEGAKA